MIKQITGIVAGMVDSELILEIGPMSFGLNVPLSTGYKVGQKTSLYVYMHWHQDNGPIFFGFTTELEKQLFILIIGCSGIGPKIAMAILSSLTPSSFIEAIQTANVDTLSKVNGLGAKKVEQMIVGLKHKVKKLVTSQKFSIKSEKINNFSKITQVLDSLNYSQQEVSAAINYITKSSEDKKDSFDVLMRSALSFLSKSR